MNTLYAWAIPAFVSGAPVDHTWVTTYDNRINQHQDIADVVANAECYWFCWGTFHSQGSSVNGALGAQVGNLARAQCLVQPDAESHLVYPARGTIFAYGIDGVCHQLANQVLLATGIGGATPLTVSAARGYQASTYLYGTYGLQTAAWGSKMNACGGSGGRAAPRPGVMSFSITEEENSPMAQSSSVDEFEIHLRKKLGEDNVHLSEKLLDLRRKIQSQAKSERDAHVVPPTVDELNARNQKALDEAAKVLSRDQFVAVFGFPPEQKINLVNAGPEEPVLRAR